MIIRPATADDMPGIWQVRYAVLENTLEPGRISDDELLRSLDADGRGWVAVQANRIVGFTIGLHTGNLWALFVHPDVQGRGIGSRLQAQLLTWFARQPVDRLWLATGTHTRARRFYQASGWQLAGPYGDDEVRLERPNPG